MSNNNEISDVSMERESIAGMLRDPSVLSDVSPYKTMKDLFSRSEDINPYSVSRQMSVLGITMNELQGGSLKEHLEEIKVGISLNKQGTFEHCQKLATLEVCRERMEAARNVAKFLKDKSNQAKPVADIVTFTDQLFQGNLSFYTRTNDQEFSYIFDTVEQVIEERANNPILEFGYFSPFERYNYLYDALYSPSDINATASRSNVGKAQNINCKVLTPDGWKKIGNIKVGDQVIGSDGRPKSVLGVYPQGVKKSFKVIMDDGGFTYSCDEHLWETTTFKNRKNKTNKNATVKSLKEISETLIDIHGGANHGIFFVKPVEFSKKELPLDPYLLGVLIGDGCMSDKKSTTFTSADQEIVDKVSSLMPLLDRVSKISPGTNKYDYRISKKNHCASNNYYGEGNGTETQKILKELGLHGLKSYEKFIPELYKYSSIEDRLALLRGLMDTDGNGDKKSPSVCFNSTSEELARGVRELAWSLGARASITLREKTYYYKEGEKVYCKPLWRVWITLQTDSGINPFLLSRKANNFTGGKKKKFRYIKAVEQVEDAESVCIKIDAEDHLYVTDDYILTHNTCYGFFLATYVADKYQTPGLWIDCGEMTEFQSQIRGICSFTKGAIPSYYLKTGLWKKEPSMVKAYNEIKPRIQRLKKYFAFKNIGGMNSKEICGVIRRFWLSKVGRFSDTIPSFGSKLGPCFPVTYDYLKPLPSDDHGAAEWQTMGAHLQDLKNLITQEVPAGINTFLQLNKSGITRGKSQGQYDDSEGAWGLSDRIYHNVSRGENLRFKTKDELASENQMYGNCVLANVKRRDLGKGFKEALAPVRMPDGSLKDNHLHMNQDSFYWECLGDLATSAQELEGPRKSRNGDEDDNSDVILK